MYHTLFDMQSITPFDWTALVIALGVTVVVLIAFNNPRYILNGPPAWVAWVIIAFIALFAAYVTVVPYEYRLHNLTAYKSGKVQVVQGPVENYSVLPSRKWESFTVGHHRFIYSYYEDMGRFHAVGPLDPIRPGMVLRVTYVRNDDIVRRDEWIGKKSPRSGRYR